MIRRTSRAVTVTVDLEDAAQLRDKAVDGFANAERTGRRGGVAARGSPFLDYTWGDARAGPRHVYLDVVSRSDTEIQVRGRADAFYRSAHEPWAANLTGTLGRDPGWDPLGVAVEEGNRQGVSVHAWINAVTGWAGTTRRGGGAGLDPGRLRKRRAVCGGLGHLPESPRVEQRHHRGSPPSSRTIVPGMDGTALARHIERARMAGAEGISVFSYTALNDAALWTPLKSWAFHWPARRVGH